MSKRKAKREPRPTPRTKRLIASLQKVLVEAASMSTASDEPLNVRAARVMGWTMLDPRGEAGWEGEPPASDSARTKIRRRLDQHFGVPDFASDPGWVVRMFNTNQLIAERRYESNVLVVRRRIDHEGGIPYGLDAGGDLGAAVLAWVVAAGEAGVEIKQ